MVSLATVREALKLLKFSTGIRVFKQNVVTLMNVKHGIVVREILFVSIIKAVTNAIVITGLKEEVSKIYDQDLDQDLSRTSS